MPPAPEKLSLLWCNSIFSKNNQLIFAVRQRIACGGWGLLSPALFKELEKRSYVYAPTALDRAASSGMPGGGTQVLPAKLEAEAGLLGACILPLHISKTALVAD